MPGQEPGRRWDSAVRNTAGEAMITRERMLEGVARRARPTTDDARTVIKVTPAALTHDSIRPSGRGCGLPCPELNKTPPSPLSEREARPG